VIVRSVLLIVFSAVATIASGQVPVPVVERTTTQEKVATRVSLFSNRVVVVTVRRGGTQDFMRRITLPEDQYMVYLGTMEVAAEELDKQPVSSQVDTSHAEVVLTLHTGPNTPRTIRFSPMSVVTLPLARIQGALDDLQLQVFEASPSAEAMRTWVPEKGDRVELMNGSGAKVVEIRDDGTLILEHDSTYVRESIPFGMRDTIILRVKEPEL
jgi:hypothetical protein